jgi:hypothetical protein
VAKGVQFSYSGGIEFSNGASGFNCGVHMTFTTKLADEFEVSKFELTTKGGITSLTLSGSGEAEDNGGEFKVGIKGSLSMSEENSDTYRIEELP